MKLKVILLFIYLAALFTLPSVRALKLQFNSSCTKTINTNNHKDCAMAQVIMGLSFTPLQIINKITFHFKSYFIKLASKKINSFYDEFFVSTYLNEVWNPPKI